MFEALTGNKPLSWQRRLYTQWHAGDIKGTINLPTGMGKTSVMAIWLIARELQARDCNRRLPTRLVYVVDRRTVVDQATALAEKLAANSANAGIRTPPKISTLRGQFADNRRWTVDPSAPAIIIGTVDMIGSRLLFSGYRSSYKQRPLDAGLLGQDSLLILDEAHLSEPFERLLREICDTGQFQKHGDGRPCGWPLRLVCMSATSGGQNGDNVFALTDADGHGGGDLADAIVIERFNAPKHLAIHEPLPTPEQNKALASQAVKLSEGNSRVIVYVRSPENAGKIAEIIRSTASTTQAEPGNTPSAKGRGKGKERPYLNGVEILTGTMRGLERDELLQKAVMKRFLSPENQPDQGPAFLVSTSAGEVGLDLNADHLVCDAAPLDSIIQRFGRVNRRGQGEALLHIYPAVPPKRKKISKKEEGEDTDTERPTDIPEHTFESATQEATQILASLPKAEDGLSDASPCALAKIAAPTSAISPKPKTAELTDILLDAWSMTTICEPMPGRPPVADWLRGPADDLPDTTIAWRAELDLGGFGDLGINDVEEWFDAHRVLPHETLTVPTTVAAAQIVERWNKLEAEGTTGTIANRPCILDRAGLRIITIRVLMDALKNRRLDTITNASIILPASFGGIERGCGLLDPEAPRREPRASTRNPKSTDAEAPDPEAPVSNAPAHSAGAAHDADVADVHGEQSQRPGRRGRFIRVGDRTIPLCGETPPDAAACSEFGLDLPSGDDTVRQLVSAVPAGERPQFSSKSQTLNEHVQSVGKHARALSAGLQLTEPFANALLLAAEWHDHGKRREFWQRAVGGTLDHPLAKSGGRMRRIAADYRHEFGSLREFLAANAGGADCDTLDLAAHLIAAHHGRARPHFPKGGFDPDDRAASPGIAIESIRRFARLQRKYGHWHLAYLENLLRCADARASSDDEVSRNV